MSIGFPKGVTVTNFVDWLASTGKISKIAYIVTPRGVSYPISPDSYQDGEGEQPQLGEGGVSEQEQLPPGEE